MIKSIYIENFGCVRNCRIDFDKSLNIIYGENETGKSTICAFIQAMLYGMDNSRKADVRSVPRKRYMPLDGSRMAGSMEISHYRINRVFGNTSKGDIVNIVDLTTGEKVDNNIGKELLGIGKKAFSNILCIEGYNSKIISDDEILTRLANLKQSYDENISYEHSLEIIDSTEKNIKGKKGLGTIQADVDCLKSEYERQMNEYNDFIESGFKLETLKNEEQELKGNYDHMLDLIENMEINKQYTKYIQLKKECDVLEEELGRLKEEMERNKDMPSIPYVHKLDIKSKPLTVGDKALDGLKNTAVLFSIIGVIMLVWVVVGKFTNTDQYTNEKVAGMLLSVIIAVALYITHHISSEKKLAEAEKALEQIQTIYQKFNVRNVNEYSRAYEEAHRESVLNRITELEIDINERHDVIDGYQNELAGKDAKQMTGKEEDIREDFENTKKRLFEIEKEVYVCNEILKKEVHVPEKIFYELEIKQDRLNELKTRLEILRIAREEICDAFSELQREFAPKLNNEVKNVLTYAVGDKYDDVAVNEDFNLLLMNNKSVVDSSHFSNGTLDLAYLSLKIALANIILSDRDYFFLMDDALIQYDDARAMKVMNYLRRYGKQVIYFTCQKRFSGFGMRRFTNGE